MYGMDEKSKEISAEIMRHLQEIKALLEANGGLQYLSMCIYANGAIEFHNGYGIENCDCKGLFIDGYMQGERDANN